MFEKDIFAHMQAGYVPLTSS